ncbi:6-phospho-3-hexuloisomerase [Candidatus Bathyarchaeota archaeon ex4484_135]|nr:MAG: 6-phospho-3-hexuloisomerase [Candidatus Bathyarchaeota archaeon ex4484_135]
MGAFRRAAREIIEGTKKAIDEIDLEQVEELARMLVEAKERGRKIFVVGMGRSGFVGRAFALRLMNMSFDVYVVGETITPAAEKGDILIAISGSGETKGTVSAAEVAKEIGARVVAITSHPESTLGRMADHVVVVKGRTKVAERKDYIARQITGEMEPLGPLGTMFENACMVFLDSLIVELMARLGITEDEIRKRHANIE